MSEVRVCVEWVFRDIANTSIHGLQKNVKIGLNGVGKLCVVSALLRTALTCLYGNQTSQFFNLDPPLIRDYFS